MKSLPRARIWLLLVAGSAAAVAPAGETLIFEEPFRDRLDPSWTWIREDPAAWRLRDGALELRVLPGNLWGGANDARNVLVRPAPDPGDDELVITVTIENAPTEQYEQVNLAWYYDDRHMVKLGREVVDGPVCVVMGREERDQCRTLAKPPVPGRGYQLRLVVRGLRIRGEYRAERAGDWTPAGECDLPAPPGGHPKISLHAYQGPAHREHWARLTDFRISRRTPPAR
jgi:regulation of enolase protein 1 (concanavalin A-like superfamily)